jgi:hypothetical protein
MRRQQSPCSGVQPERAAGLTAIASMLQPLGRDALLFAKMRQKAFALLQLQHA